MDSSVLLVFLFTFFGCLISLFSATMSSFTSSDLEDLAINHEHTAKKLQHLKNSYADRTNPFIILEAFCYAIAIPMISHNSYNSVWMAYVGMFVIFFAIIVFRFFFYSIGLRFGKQLIFQFSFPLTLLATINKPINSIIKFLTESVSGKKSEEASRDEISALVDSAREEGTLDAGEYRILKNIIKFSDVYVSDVMTPRTVVFSVEAVQTVQDVINLPELKMYSRFPIWEGESIDDGVVGYVLSKDVLYAALVGKKDSKLKDLARKIYFIPENVELDNALEQFLHNRQHMMIVVDEYGGVDGILTMEDVLETILGAEIVDEADRIVDLRLLAKQKRDSRIANKKSSS